MASLRALLSSTSGPTVNVKEEPDDVIAMPKNRITKRAAFEEWHTKKFRAPGGQPQLLPHDDENRPVELIKRLRGDHTHESSTFLSACSAADEIAASPFDSDVAFQREQFVYLRSMAARCKDESVRRVNRLLPVGSTVDAETMQRNLSLCIQMLAPAVNPSSSWTYESVRLRERSTSPITMGKDNGRNEMICDGMARKLTAPKLSRHNDAAYYPNIQCILCKEWVCSRNRYMHIESHLQYRPYKCSVCGYDNRKEIFISLHIKKTHGGAATVEYKPDPELEHRAWVMAEQCLQHTREVLQKAHEHTEIINDEGPSTVFQDACGAINEIRDKVDEQFITKYASQYRPKLYNSQRAEKSLVIEDSLKMGIVPDFTEVFSREVQCQVCDGFVIGHVGVLEEHARSHLSQPSYRCSIDGCLLEHSSKNFLTRHMKEVHKYRRNPIDITDSNPSLKSQFVELASRCFPDHLSNFGVLYRASRRTPVSRSASLKTSTQNEGIRCERRAQSISGLPTNLASQSSPSSLVVAASSSHQAETQCSTLSGLLSISTDNIMPQARISSTAQSAELKRSCNFCEETFDDEYMQLYRHAKQHLNIVPYECSECKLGDVDRKQLLEHIATVHSLGATLIDRMNDALSRQCCVLFAACFPDVTLQPQLHDRIERTV
uniref:C2H2-type domain-containing protein n=1 Tax=Ascaris lumbricoides TaxID=6252 RepID=A0A9J2P7H4_ASCLU